MRCLEVYFQPASRGRGGGGGDLSHFAVVSKVSNNVVGEEEGRNSKAVFFASRRTLMDESHFKKHTNNARTIGVLPGN